MDYKIVVTEDAVESISFHIDISCYIELKIMWFLLITFSMNYRTMKIK